MFEIQKTNGKTNMDDYFFKYLQEKKRLTEEKSFDNLKLPFQTSIPGNQFPINNQPNLQSNLQNLKFNPTINPMIQPVNINAINNPNLKLNFPFNKSIIPNNPNMPINNTNLQNVHKLILQQQIGQRMPQNNMLLNNANYNNLLNNPNFASQFNLLGLKNLANNFPNRPIPNMINKNLINADHQIPNFNNLQNFQNPSNNMNPINTINTSKNTLKDFL